MQEPAQVPSLFDTEFLKRLEYLALVARKRAVGDRKGDRRALRKGTSVEFADYRDYTPGDDLRRVDWNAYARIDKLLLKLFEEEEELFVYLLLDTSESMRSKLDYARQTTAALAYVALSNQDRVSLATFSSNVSETLGPLSGKNSIFPIFDFLSKCPTGGQTDFQETLSRYARHVKRRGLLLVISDFLDPAGKDAMLKNLLTQRFEVLCLQLHTPEEADPTLQGDFRLIDVETDESKDVYVTKELAAAYRQAFETYCQEIQQFCIQRAMRYVRATTATDFDDLVMKLLRQGGLLR